MPFFSFGRKKEAKPEPAAVEATEKGAAEGMAVPEASPVKDFNSRTIGGVPMDWPEESASIDSPAVWQPSPAVPWASSGQEQEKAVNDYSAPSFPFAQNGSPLPDGREAVASFQPDGSHQSLSDWNSPVEEAADLSAKSVADFSPQPILNQPPAPLASPPVELHLIQGSMPVIPDWEPGIPVPIKEEPTTDACLPTSDYSQDSAEEESSPHNEAGFTWDKVLAAAPVMEEKPQVHDHHLPGIAADLSASAAAEAVKTTPPPAWGAPAWGRPRTAKDEAPASTPAPNLTEAPADTSTDTLEPKAGPEPIASDSLAWPLAESANTDFVKEQSEAENSKLQPFAWPEPKAAEFGTPEPKAANLPPALLSSEPIAWPEPASDISDVSAPNEFGGESLPQALTEPEAIAWPSVKDEDIAWPSSGNALAEAKEAVTETETASPAFSWPAPVMELPPISVLDPELEAAEPPRQEENLSAAPQSEAQVNLSGEPATPDVTDDFSALDQPAPWGVEEKVADSEPAEVPASRIGQWQEEEEEDQAHEASSEAEDSSRTWGLPSTWMAESSAPAAEEAQADDRWVSAEEEQAQEEPASAAKAAPTIDPEAEIEKSLERLFSLNRSFRWKKIGELLQELGLVSEADLNEALKTQKDTKRPLGKTLVEMGIISDRLLLKVLAAQKDVIPWYFDDALEPDLLSLLEPEFCLRCQVLPVRQLGTTLTLVMRNPSDVDTIDFVQHTTGLRVEPALGEEETLAKKIEEGYSRDARSHRAHVDALVQEAFKSSDIKVSHIEDSKSASAIEEETRPVTAIVQKLIAEAIKMRASDIHMEPTLHDLQVRYRIDGRLHKVNSVPREIQPMIAARVKIMAELDPVEWRIPQDGRISFEHDRRVVDLRVSVLPSFYGSRIVMRLLDRSAGVKSLDDIGFSSNNLSIFKTLIMRPYGLFLVTGPTGSGKTTSLYAALNEVKDDETNIITCEDPVEYNLDGISQSQVNTKIGLTFAAQLRSILRQDPDVVLVGEIRDHETAETAIRASMTGHLVFSTLHCNDAPSAIPRLLDMNIDPFLLSTSLIGVMGQRLIRRICPDCGTAYKPTQDETIILERTFGLVGVDKLYKGTGCVKCAHTGFKGRFAVHEIMPVTQEISSYIADRASTEKLGEISRFYGYRTMQEDTLERVLAGQTTLKEAQRLLAFDDIPRIDPVAKKR